ncbi:MAG: ATP synthase F1 subunit epsilon [Bacteroidales bacterium]
MLLEIITPDKKIYSGKVDLVKVPGSSGSFAILQNHAPIISTLNEGEIKVITKKNETLYFQVDSGVIEVSNNEITVLVETLINADEEI